MMEDEPNLNIEEAVAKKIGNKSKKTEESSAGNSMEENPSTIDQEQQATVQSRAAENDASNGSRSPSRNSPDPNCAICLEKLQNKSFTDSCFHMFCFTCLKEWSKVKAECPLCKQQFKSIVHNVRSPGEYDQYHIAPRRNGNIFTVLFDQAFRYRTTLTTERVNERNNNEWSNSANRNNLEHAYHQEIASHRLRYAPHSVHLYARDQATYRIPCSFRQSIYDQNLWVVPMPRERVRLATPQFYQQNPACTHRLIPWLNRELLVLLQNGESHVTFVMELIMALINRYEITSREFFLHVEPYLSHHTSHFIHEFYNFATSPNDMGTYDNHLIYENRAHSLDSTLEGTNPSDDNDVVFISENATRETQMPTTSNLGSRRAKLRSYRLKKYEYQKLKKLVLKRNSKSNLWSSALHSAPSSFPSANGIDDSIFPAPGTSTASSFSALLEVAAAAAAREICNAPVPKNDDECMIVDEFKPKHERTPELVVLSSEDEQSTKVDDILSENNLPFDSQPSKEPISVTLESDSSDIECIYESSSKETTVGTQNDHPSTSAVNDHPSTSAVSDQPSTSGVSDQPSTSGVSDQPSTSGVNDQPSTSGVRDSPIPSTSQDHKNNHHHISPSPSFSTPYLSFSHIGFSVPPTSGDHKNKYNRKNPTSIPSSSSKSWFSENENNSFPSTNSSNLERRRDNLSSSHYASTESYSDSECPPDRNSEHKKLKLRSVIAHYSLDPGSDSSRQQRDNGYHSTSHKKHKDKKKKKKKHSHKHKHRIYSDSD